jgi:site-specific DNA-methyltransferase (adenine-specific)
MTVTLYQGDCLQILPTLEAGSVDAVITDPPYGIGFAAQPTKWQRRAGYKPVEWDNDRPDFIAQLLRIGNVQVIWGGNYFILPVSRGWLAWCKPDAPPSMGNIEMAWTNIDRTAKHIVCSIAATNKERVGHPTQKPLVVMKWCIELCTQPGDTILDPFMGSGTTGVACVKTGRNFIGIELDEGYFKIAQRRIEEAQMQLPLLEVTT